MVELTKELLLSFPSRNRPLALESRRNATGTPPPLYFPFTTYSSNTSSQNGF